MKISNTTLSERKRIRLLRTYRKAWAKEHSILQQMLIHGTSPLELSCTYGLSQEDISNMYQRLLTVAFPWVLEYRQSEKDNFRTKDNRHSKLYTAENMMQNEKTPSLPADSKRNDLLKLKLTECFVIGYSSPSIHWISTR